MHFLKRGVLIAVEGIDGAGKTVLAKKLSALLLDEGFEVVITKEPGASKLGKHLRSIVQEAEIPRCAKAEFLLFAADRAQHFQEVIIPGLEAGKIILSDRLSDSSIVYQGYGRGLEVETIQSINAWAMNNITPDLVCFISIDMTTAQQRLSTRNEPLSAFDRAKKDFIEKLINGFEAIFTNKKGVIHLDGKKQTEELALYTKNTIVAWIKNNNLIV